MSFSLKKRVHHLIKSTFRPNINSPEILDTSSSEYRENTADIINKTKHFHPMQSLCNYSKMPEVYYGKTGLELPKINLEKPSQNVCACFSGPNGGLTKVKSISRMRMAKLANLDDELTLSTDDSSSTECILRKSFELNDTENLFAEGCQKILSSSNEIHNNLSQFQSPDLCSKQQRKKTTSSESQETDNFISDENIAKYDWNLLDDKNAYGVSTSLYEKHPLTGILSGSPIADVFGIVMRENNAIIALADGLSWGKRARLAARCAIRGALDHMNNVIEKFSLETSQEVFHHLLGAFHAGHALIIQEDGALTTLCLAYVCRMRDSNVNVLCVCNVGDSFCYVYNSKYGVREVTSGSHDLSHIRRDTGGALGPVDGRSPQLHNLTCSMTFVENDDIVFITSDGVSDNFDPIVAKFCSTNKSTDPENAENHPSDSISTSTLKCRNLTPSQIPEVFQKNFLNRRHQSAASLLPIIEIRDRHSLMMHQMRHVIECNTENRFLNEQMEKLQIHDNIQNLNVSAEQVCKRLIQFAHEISREKRQTLEDPALYQAITHSKTEESIRKRLIRSQLAKMPGKLDHATVVAYRVGVHNQTKSNGHTENCNIIMDDSNYYIANMANKNHGNEMCCKLSIKKPSESKCISKILELKEVEKSFLYLEMPAELQQDVNIAPKTKQSERSPYEEKKFAYGLIPVQKIKKSL